MAFSVIYIMFFLCFILIIVLLFGKVHICTHAQRKLAAIMGHKNYEGIEHASQHTWRPTKGSYAMIGAIGCLQISQFAKKK
jgi:disulfide bond formation protein DsbB